MTSNFMIGSLYPITCDHMNSAAPRVTEVTDLRANLRVELSSAPLVKKGEGCGVVRVSSGEAIKPCRGSLIAVSDLWGPKSGWRGVGETTMKRLNLGEILLNMGAIDELQLQS